MFDQVKGILLAFRPLQWVKNVIIFAGLVFDRQLGFNNLQPLMITIAGFILFCLLSSSVYLINDVADIESDRNHPKKKQRPIASGRISVRTAIIISILLILIVIPLSYILSTYFLIIVLIYLFLNLAYSKWIKHIILLDVLAISLGFVLRVSAGTVLIDVARFSPWLIVVTTLGALYIGFGKRRSELAVLGDDALSHRGVLDGYTLELLDQYLVLTASTTVIAYSLYTFSAENLPDNRIMMLTIPFVLFGIFRYLYLVQVRKEGGAPENIIFKDVPLFSTIILWGVTVLLIFYIY